MARDGSGTFNLPQAAFVAGTTIESAKVNSNFSDIASALTGSIAKDGQTTYTGNQPMGGFKLTGAGAATGTGDSVRYDEFKLAFRSLLVGLTMSNSSTSPDTEIDVSAGSWTEASQTQVYGNAAGTIDCATTGANGLDTGSLANSTWYHAFAIAKTDGTTAFLASTSATAPTMPSGYTLKRRIGSFKTDGSADILLFVQDGDEFQWETLVADIAVSTPGASAVTRTLASVPTGVRVKALIIYEATNTDVSNPDRLYFSDLSVDDTSAEVVQETPNIVNAGSGVAAAGGRIAIWTNTSAQIRSRNAYGGSGTALTINTLGWIDRRGRDD